MWQMALASERETPAHSQVPLLEVSNLVVNFDGVGQLRPAVDGISFRVYRGETVAVVGQSGSGKSTAIAAVLGLLPETGKIAADSSIRLNGTEIVGMGEKQLRALRGTAMALVPQDPMSNLNPVVRIGPQIDEAVTAHNKVSKSEASARSIASLSRAGLPEPEKRIRQYPHQFSGGMRQRALIAMALVNEPMLLVADEPTSALDVTVQRTILDNLAHMVDDSGTAVLLITHDLGLAAERADYVLVMHEGKIVEQGPAATILINPEHEYTRSLVSAAPASSGIKVRERNPLEVGEPEVILSVKNLVKQYKVRESSSHRKTVFTAVDDVSFSIKKGRTLALVGESGSGKSTSAWLAMRLTDPTSGRIYLQGADVTDHNRRQLTEFRSRVQPIFQDPYASLDPMFTVERILLEPLDAFGVGSPKERRIAVAEMLDSVALPTAFLDRHPSELSGGQRQRVAIARALALKPDVVVCDEAVSALDVLVQAQILDLLEEIQRERGLSYLFISHDLGVVRAIADDVAVMQRGRIVEQGTVADIFESPQTEYTAALLDAVPGRDLFQRLGV
jgi:peptide/nickel transport system ATP-binding protein